MTMHRIASLSVTPELAVLRLKFSDGFEGRVSLAPLLAADGVMEALRDPQFFATVRIGEHGRSVGWDGEIDLCADALRQRCEAPGLE